MELTAKPSISLSASKIMQAFITKRKRPSVISVIGKVRKIKIGFKILLSNTSTTATINAFV